MSSYHPSVEKLHDELQQARLKHAQETYDMQLELTTMKQAKEATEDRMAELYRDLQVVPHAYDEASDNKTSQQYAAAAQVSKYQRMLRIMNNQMTLLRNGSDALVKSLKDEISDLIEEKVQTELALIDQLALLEREKIRLEEVVAAAGQSRQYSTHATGYGGEDVSERCIEVSLNEDELTLLKNENAMLQQTIESMHKPEELLELQQRLHMLEVENEELRGAIQGKEASEQHHSVVNVTHDDKLQQCPSEEILRRVEQAQNTANASLDRLALQWKDIDTTVAQVDRLTDRLKSNAVGSDSTTKPLLSVLETFGLVHAQAKASLMWTELRLQNHLDHLTANPDMQQTLQPSGRDCEIFKELMASVEKVEFQFSTQVQELKLQSCNESTELRKLYEDKVNQLHHMTKRQTELEGELTTVKRHATKKTLATIEPAGTEKSNCS